MKQEDVEKVLISYKDSMGSCSKVPNRAPVRSPWGKRFAFAATAMAFVGLGMVAMWPQDAKAGTLRRMTMAIGNVKTMEVVATIERPVGHWFTLWHSYYKDGMWRNDVDKSTGMKVTEIIRDGQTLTHWSALDHATIEPTTDEDLQSVSGESNVVDYAKGLLNSGQVSIERTVTISEHEPVNGRAAYVIVMDRPADEYHSELVVDKATNLPIVGTVKVHQTGGLGSETVQMRQEYRYDTPISNDIFTFEHDLRVVKIAEARAAFLAEKSRPLGEVQGTRVLDASVTPSGTVWVVVSAKDESILPTTLTTKAGDVFARGRDVGSTTRGDELRDGNRSLVLVPFTNMNPNRPLPKEASLQLAHREAMWTYHAEPEDLHATAVGNPLSLKLQVEPELRPSYFPAFGLDRYGFELEIQDWNSRAKKYEEDKQYLDAAKAYESCAKAYRSFVKRGAYFPMAKATKCYALAGDAEKSKQAAAIAEDLRLKKEH